MSGALEVEVPPHIAAMIEGWDAWRASPGYAARRAEEEAETAEQDRMGPVIARLAAEYRLTREARAHRANMIIERIVDAAGRLAAIDRHAVQVGVGLVRDHLMAGPPPLCLGTGWDGPTAADVARDAADWATMADDEEVVAILRAGLAQLRDRTAMQPRLATMALAEVWRACDPQTRRAFLARVDPQGNLRGRG